MAKRAPKSPAAKSTPKSKAKPRAAVRPAKSSAQPAAGDVYQLKISLFHIQPPVWRRVLVKDCSLAVLHEIIQTSMGWQDCHLHLFQTGKGTYGAPEQWAADPWMAEETGDERKLKLSQLVAQGVKKFTYEYDMGDSWRHMIAIEKTLPAEAGVRYPRCVNGARACPPEDCGGAWGYGDFIAAIQNPAHERHEELREWIGGDFDPEKFDPEAVDRQLAKLRL